MKKVKIISAIVPLVVILYSTLVFFEVVPFYPKVMTVLIISVVIDAIVEMVRIRK